MDVKKLQEKKIFLIDKPKGLTSYKVLEKIKLEVFNTYKRKIKIGHSGTLDPLATGLLIIGINEGTKSLKFFFDLDKIYITTFNISGRTASYDAETPIEENFNYNHITLENIFEAINKFKGYISQVPPLYSAKKIMGVRAYSLARKNIQINLKPIQVFIKEIEILNIQLPKITIKVHCSKGTYIRSLAYDIGKELTGGAFIEELQRIAIGNYNIIDAYKLDDFLKYLKTSDFYNKIFK